jgi:hypothetical protein
VACIRGALFFRVNEEYLMIPDVPGYYVYGDEVVEVRGYGAFLGVSFMGGGKMSPVPIDSLSIEKWGIGLTFVTERFH